MTSTTLREMLVKQEPRTVTCCYVCSGTRAEYVLYSKPFRDNPFFPFLELHQPPEGAESMRSDGRVLVCLVCYTFLNQQWDCYEKSKTPYNKRLYWLKRLDGGPFAGMDLNLQQDYESLFESSNAAIETECRSKSKHNRSHHSSEVDVIKTKHNEPNYSNSMGYSSQSSEKPDNLGSNILDLSMSTRTPSRSSSTASPGVISEVCYTCSQESKALAHVFVKFIRNCPTFPNLAVHPKPPRAKPIDSDGRIRVCSHCHLCLIQQWECYQKRSTPQHERIYKISSADSDVIKQEAQAKDKSFVCYTCGMVSQLSVQRFINAYPEGEGEPFYSFLANSTPYPGANKLTNGKAGVCSLCYKAFFRQFQVYEVSKTPEEQRKYRTLNESVCDSTSVLRQHLESSASEPTVESKRECYLCECVTESLFNVNSLPTGDMYFPFIKSLPKPSSAFPMDNHGRVKICSQCHTSLSYQWNAFENAFIPINQRQYKIPGSKLQLAANHGIAASLHSVSHPAHSKATVEDEHKLSVKKAPGSVCSLCENPLIPEHACFLETLPRENCMYFPSIRALLKSSGYNYADQYGRILSCSQCFSILKNQWEVFESAHVPHSQRQYEIFPPKSEKERVVHFGNDGLLAETSGALHIQVSSPDLKVDLMKHSSNVEPLLTTVNTLPISSITISTSAMSNPSSSPQMADLKGVSMKTNLEDPVPRITGPLDVPYIRPLVISVPICCYVCGEMNTSGLTYPIRSQPVNDIRMEKTPDDVPFFPFLSKHPVPDGAEKLTNDGSALACMFCYHSLVSQWLAYESSTYPEDENRWHRRYNTHNYVCYICGITTYRKRMCSISVKDFPFLLEHARPAGALTVLNGEYVVTCQTCFESITSQWKDFERMKVPVEMRKYNWIVLPPPPDDENSRGCQILRENSGSALNLPPGENDHVHLDESGIPHGLKPSSSHLSVPGPYGVSKSAGRNVMSPVHQSGPHPSAGFSPFTNNINPALNATRTSSFAAALRKLAKQAVDPIAEKELSPISPASSPASSQQSIHSRHHAPMPMYMNSHNPNPPGHGSSSPSISSSQSSQGKALDLGRYSNTHRNGNMVEPVSFKMESSKLISSSNDKRNDMPSGNKHLAPPNLPPSLRQDSLSRGFQPYRNSEDRRPTPPQVYNPSPPPNSMSSYAYHPSMLQSSRMPPQSYSRLEESMYMERYGLLRPSTMPYPPPTNMIPHPRPPLYPSNQYPPELISQSMRPVPSNSSPYSSNRYNSEEENVKESNMLRKREMEIYREHERYLEREGESRERESREREMEYMRKERNMMGQNPLTSHHSSSRLDTSNEDKGLMGSITHGTPRDYVRNMSPPVSTSTTPLNLATSVAHMENSLHLKEEYSSRNSRQSSNTVNGQMHPRATNHMSYRKENDSTSSYRMHYQMSMENEKKPNIHSDSPDNSAPVSSQAKAPYFMERDNQKSVTVETRTLSLGSVINSQINGIFARDNILCNNSYFPPNLETNHWESSIKQESDNKKTFSAQEPYMIPSKVPSNEKSRESLHSEPSSNKLPPYMLTDHPYMYRGDSNGYPSSTFKAKEPLSTLVPKNRDVMSYESEVSSYCEPVERIVSVLDAREAKLRRLRKDAAIEESDESGIESDEEDPERFKQLLSISKGPPLKLEPNSRKTEFLSYLNLVTDSKRQTLELKKCMRRHKALRERSLSPVEEPSVKREMIEYDPSHLAELSNRLCFTEEFQSKTEFLRSLGLKYLPPEQKEDHEMVKRIVREERLRRYGLMPYSQRCIDLQGSHLRKRGYNILNSMKHGIAKKPSTSQVESLSKFAPSERGNADKNKSSVKEIKSLTASVQRLSSFLKPPMRTVTIPVPPLIPTSQIVSHASEAAQDKSAAVVVAKDPRVRLLNKEFAQEFHNSVLQTTQMQLAEKKNIPPVVPLEPLFQKSPSSVGSEKSDCFPTEYKPPFRWPGIEAIMESYECHISEQSVEKKFLFESCQKLKALNEKSNIEVECLGKQTEELIREKHLLDCKRQELQSSFEKLKLFIQRFR